jgi:site-specific recombinase XerC
MNESNMEMLKWYLSISETNKRLTKRTIKGFYYDIRLFLNFIGDKPLNEVTHQDCEGFFVYCSTERNNSDQALNRKHTAVNLFFKELIKRDKLDIKNPMRKIDPPKVRRKLRPYLRYDEIQKLFEYLEEKKDLRTLAIASLFFYSGIRLSELHQLNRDSLDFERCRFSVLGKGDSERNCIFHPYATEKIKDYLSSRKDDNPAMFYSRNNRRISHRQIQVTISQAVEAGVGKHMTPHNLRHSAAMFLLKQGVPLDKIQGFLGHRSIATTQIYAHNSIDDVQAAVEKVW